MKYLVSSNKGISSLALILISASSSVVFAGYSYFTNKEQNITPKAISSYEECINAGYPVLEIYPEQCITPNGRSFVKEIKGEEKLPDEKTNDINSFEECINADYPKIQSDPNICKAPNGKAYPEKTNSGKNIGSSN